MVNIVILGGNLTSAPELRYTTASTAVCSLRVACNSSYKTATGEKRETVLFIDVVTWGRQAESCAEYLDKGSKVLVEGELKQREWDDRQTGRKVSKIEIHAQRVQFLSSSKKSNGIGAPATATASGERTGGQDEDVPF